MRLPAAVVAVLVALAACSDTRAQSERPRQPLRGEERTAVFAGGCFWSIERNFEQIDGVIEAESGFTGGHVSDPSYAQVVRGGTGHVEAVRVTYDSGRVTYRQLVDRFWRMIDVTDADGQFCDQGPSYVSAVYATESQRPIAEASRRAAVRVIGADRFVTPVRAARRFWPAEAYHQDFARRNPARYQAYSVGCRRAERLRAVWAGR
ncbi:peptide-methionine (S)-S-oxide reductase MsrA [Brevundimonas sp.]|uniref:peptide-methionine (S)-S-oxide reductase MsrA n=1 Tax=Brevundimonas sp. TaxID=1871086 RepID=UPI0025CE02F2|nr:peptide-methionine (S)-S-oxide reductase MsrA [Brevundimonas sp.]